MTYIPETVSDLLACAITGDSRNKRSLYTDDEEHVRTYRRIVRLNGISNAVTQSDLMNRLTYFYTRKITGKVIDDKELLAEIHELRPFVLAELFDLVSKAMSIYPTLKEPSWAPRMKGWFMWAIAVSKAMGKDEDWFPSIFRPYISRQDEEALEGDMLGVALQHIAGSGGFLGTSTELFSCLNDWKEGKNIIEECKIDVRDPTWPDTTKKLGMRLGRISPNMPSVGVHVYTKITHKQAEARFGDKLHRITKGRTGDYDRKDRMVIISPKELEPPAALSGTHSEAMGTDLGQVDKEMCSN